ncbi:MAG: HAD family hydrolase [Acidobacteria bacterium]|nr:HAD family hydrolase [Acidobacteriota bacterium]MDA1234035.1 HAD family hydrolase [Acidobacteriota bacterium]
MLQATCFVLDLDDTLYPERDYVRSGFAIVDSLAAERIGLQSFGDACWERFLNGERGRIFDTVLQSRCGRVDTELVGDMVRAYRLHRPVIDLHPDARRLLDRARNLKLPLALVTDGPRESQRAKIDALALEHRFASIVVTAELGVGKSKPHPAAFELVQTVFGSDQRFVYIADNPHKDFLAPNQLGWTSISIQRTSGIYSQATAPTPAHAPQHTVTSLDDVWATAK